jgi:pimeloyl-ACP methyl ester carboxylesterase
MAERVPRAELVQIDSGHMIMWEEPDLFAGAIKAFHHDHLVAR